MSLEYVMHKVSAINAFIISVLQKLVNGSIIIEYMVTMIFILVA